MRLSLLVCFFCSSGPRFLSYTCFAPCLDRMLVRGRGYGHGSHMGTQQNPRLEVSDEAHQEEQ